MNYGLCVRKLLRTAAAAGFCAMLCSCATTANPRLNHARSLDNRIIPIPHPMPDPLPPQYHYYKLDEIAAIASISPTIPWSPYDQYCWIKAFEWQLCEDGMASWYGEGFYYRKTASGEVFKPGPFLTAAHKTMPLGTVALVRNKLNNRMLIVKINDRGPFVKERVIDLSRAAAERLAIVQNGTAPVEIYIIRGWKRSTQN